MALLSVRYSFLLDSNAGTCETREQNIALISFHSVSDTELGSGRRTHLSLRELLQEALLLVGDAELERRVDLDVGAAVLGRYQRLVRPEVVGVRVQGLKKNTVTAVTTGWPG